MKFVKVWIFLEVNYKSDLRISEKKPVTVSDIV